MKIIRYSDSRGRIGYGAERDGEYLAIDGDIFSEYSVGKEKADVAKLLAPVDPPAIYCIGLNYRLHAKESGLPIPKLPVVFAKPPSALQHPEDPIEIPVSLESGKVDYECELAVVMGRRCKNVAKEDALEYVFGYTCGNDVSARDWQLEWGGGQWCRGKSCDTFAPMGPHLVTADEIVDPNTLRIRTEVNGTVVQDSDTSDMIFTVPELVSFLSRSTTLYPGTVILTGTPQGVGMAMEPPLWLKSGDEVAIEIERIGRLSNPVTKESSAT